MLQSFAPDTKISDLTVEQFERLVQTIIRQTLLEAGDAWDSALAPALLTEAVLAEDWNSTEEQEAWRDLEKAMLS
jgi:hypothetical protein